VLHPEIRPNSCWSLTSPQAIPTSYRSWPQRNRLEIHSRSPQPRHDGNLRPPVFRSQRWPSNPARRRTASHKRARPAAPTPSQSRRRQFASYCRFRALLASRSSATFQRYALVLQASTVSGPLMAGINRERVAAKTVIDAVGRRRRRRHHPRVSARGPQCMQKVQAAHASRQRR
jgi:hypothetical protein